MKTKIKTFIAIVALGIFGLSNINATANNQSEVNAIVVSESEKSLTIEPWMLENANWNTKPEYNTAESEKALEVEAWMIADEKFVSQCFKDQKLSIEPWMTDEAIFCSAESFSESGVGSKNEKYAHRHKFQNHPENMDFNRKHEMFHNLHNRMVD